MLEGSMCSRVLFSAAVAASNSCLMPPPIAGLGWAETGADMRIGKAMRHGCLCVKSQLRTLLYTRETRSC